MILERILQISGMELPAENEKISFSDENDIADYDYYVRTFGDLDCLKDSEKDPMYCVKKAVLQKNMPEVYQAVGTEDFLIEENRMMKKYLEKEGVKVTYHEAEGIHDWSFWNKYLPEYSGSVVKTKI